MRLTLTPELMAYGAALSVVYSAASFSVALHLRDRWLSKRLRTDFWTVYAVVMAAVAAWSWLVFDLWEMFTAPPVLMAAATLAGLAAGAAASVADRRIVRGLSRSAAPRATGRERVRVALDRTRGRLAVERVQPSGGVEGPAQQSAPDAARRSAGSGALVVLLVVAMLEELLYRGVLVLACLALHPLAAAAALAGTLVLFALSHVRFGWPHVYGKFPLGAAALALVLVSGSIVPAMVAHAVFNFRIWRDAEGNLARVMRA